jgi:hypothetical protein
MNLLYNVFLNGVHIGQVRLLWGCGQDAVLRKEGITFSLATELVIEEGNKKVYRTL